MASSPVDLSDVVLAGRTFKVGPLTMGMRRRIAAVIKTVKAPEIPPVDCVGLVQAMYEPGPDEEEAIEKRAGGRLKFAEMEHIRRTIQNTVQEAVREARARAELWPPPVEDAQALIANDDDVQEVFLWEVLRPHNVGLSRGDIKGIMDDMGLHELVHLWDAVFGPAVRALTERAKRVMEEQDPSRRDRDEVPKGNGSVPGGVGVT